MNSLSLRAAITLTSPRPNSLLHIFLPCLSGGQTLPCTFINNPISPFLALCSNTDVWCCLISSPYLIMFQSKMSFYSIVLFLFLRGFSTYLLGLYILFIDITLLHFLSVSIPFIWRIEVVMLDVLYSFWINVGCAIQQVRVLCWESKDFWNKACKNI